jgi:hypothetical protein
MDPGTAVTLPGGALIGERLERAAAFRPFSGRLEEELARLVEEPGTSRPSRVSALLAAALAHLGGRDATRERVAGLGTTDRRFLMLALALEQSGDEQWRHLVCARCCARFDVGFRLSALPVTPAAGGYPWTEAAAAGKRLRLRMPTGEDEERVAKLSAPLAARALALGCVVSIDGAPPAAAELDALGEAAIDAVDAALDALAPHVATTLATACNECGAAQALELDAYDPAMIVREPGELYREVHELALRYHWSEDEILGLPRGRRRLYLDMNG